MTATLKNKMNCDVILTFDKLYDDEKWSAPIGWSSLNVNAWWASGLWPSCFPALVVYSARRCGA